MKLKSAYGLKEKIRDDRKLTLRLQWYHLTTTEAKQIGGMLEQMVQEIFEGQEMLFLGTKNGKETKTTEVRLPWKDKDNFSLYLKGFVRTDESIREQANRIKKKTALDGKWDITAGKLQPHPLFPKTAQQAEQLLLQIFRETKMEYLTERFPVETMFGIYRKYCDDCTYSIHCHIAVSAYAVGYVLQELLAQYKGYLSNFYRNTEIFAGYIFFETKTMGAHAYCHHTIPLKVMRDFTEGEYLLGYEWAAYLSENLARQLSEEQLTELGQYADITKEKDGIFYQTRCDITQYSLEQKRIYEKIFRAILKPGFSCFPVFDFYFDKIQSADEKIYLMRLHDKYLRSGESPFQVGMFYQLNPEDTPPSSACDVLKEIRLQD